VKRQNWLALAAVCGLVLCGTRFIGLAVVIGGALWLRTWRERAVVVLPSLAVYVVGLVLTDVMRPHFGVMDRSQPLAGMLLNLPGGTMSAAGGVIATWWLVGLVVRQWRHRLTRMMAGVVVCYLVGLAATVVQNRYNPALDMRLFVPITAVLFVLLVGLARRETPTLTPFVIGGVMAYAVLAAVIGWPGARSLDNKGLNSRVYWQSPLMREIRELPDTVEVYSSSPYLVWQYARRRSRAIPYTAEIADDRNSYLRSTMEDVRRTGGVMVWFNGRVNGYMPMDSFVGIMEQGPEGEVEVRRDEVGRMVRIRGAGGEDGGVRIED